MIKTYKRSKKLLVLQLIISIPLSFMFVGIPLLLFYVLRYLMDKLELTDTAVIMRVGILNRREVRLPYNKINTVTISKDPIALILGYGDVVLHTGNDVSGVKFQQVDEYQEIQQLIEEKI